MHLNRRSVSFDQMFKKLNLSVVHELKTQMKTNETNEGSGKILIFKVIISSKLDFSKIFIKKIKFPILWNKLKVIPIQIKT